MIGELTTITVNHRSNQPVQVKGFVYGDLAVTLPTSAYDLEIAKEELPAIIPGMLCGQLNITHVRTGYALMSTRFREIVGLKTFCEKLQEAVDLSSGDPDVIASRITEWAGGKDASVYVHLHNLLDQCCPRSEFEEEEEEEEAECEACEDLLDKLNRLRAERRHDKRAMETLRAEVGALGAALAADNIISTAARLEAIGRGDS